MNHPKNINLAKIYFETFGLSYDYYGNEIKFEFNDFLNRIVSGDEDVSRDYFDCFINPRDYQRKIIEQLIVLNNWSDVIIRIIISSVANFLTQPPKEQIDIQYRIERSEDELSIYIYNLNAFLLKHLI